MVVSPSEQAVRNYFVGLGAADAADFGALFSDEVKFTDPVGQPTLEGPDGVARFHKGLRRAWTSLEMTPQHVFVRGRRATAYWRASGQSATGKDIEFDGINVFELAEDARIERVDGYWDFEGVISRM